VAQPTDSLLGWVVGLAAAGGTLWTIGRRIFNTVTRSELKELLEEQRKDFREQMDRERREFLDRMDQQDTERERRHQENRGTSGSIFDRLGSVEKDLAAIGRELKVRFNS
jgi:hypothetical protein